MPTAGLLRRDRGGLLQPLRDGAGPLCRRSPVRRASRKSFPVDRVASGTSSSRTSSSRRLGLGAGALDLPPVTPIEPADRVLANPSVAEERRYCSRCNEPVGRSRDGVPGRTDGFCRLCAHPYSFTPKLAPAELVADQYEVAGCLAHGGLGWIYLAQDRRVSDRWVVLKGLLDTGDEHAVAAAVAERRFLAEVEHPNIVKIYNFVEHGQHGYAVMEYVGGTSLRGLLEERRRHADGTASPLPVAQAITYILEILPALAYLHSLGLLYCDFKPDNIIRTPSSLKLIDLGGVYRMEGQGAVIYGTPGYQAPEIGETGPTIPSDLFTVARTLAVLCTDFRGYQTTFATTLPSPDDVPLYSSYDSLYRFLVRSTAPDPQERFQTAAEMADQLLGVLREIVAAEQGTHIPGQSATFTGEFRAGTDQPGWRTLPVPLVAPDDPAAGFLATLRADDPADVVEALRHAPERTFEIQLRLVLTLIESGRMDEASSLLAECEAAEPWDWRIAWYRGVAALVSGNPAHAEEWFLDVYREVPGELAPKLALGQSAEGCGDYAEASGWYDIVSRTDPNFPSAAFGLARCRLAAGDREAAVEALDRVPDTSIVSVDARILKVRAMIQTPAGKQELTDVLAAAAVVERLPSGLAERLPLTRLVLEAALELVTTNGSARSVDESKRVLAHPMTPTGVRLGLEHTYRAMARQAPTVAERIALVDQANRIRPRTLT